jgi:hypothetical protein
MNNQESPDISKARELLRKFEHTQDHKTRVGHFEDALELLAQYAEDDSDKEERRIAQNLLKTYARRFLEELPSLLSLDRNDRLPYVCLLEEVKTSADALRAEHPALNTNFNSFIKSWASEVSDMFSRHGTKIDELLDKVVPNASAEERMFLIANLLARR